MVLLSFKLYANKQYRRNERLVELLWKDPAQVILEMSKEKKHRFNESAREKALNIVALGRLFFSSKFSMSSMQSSAQSVNESEDRPICERAHFYILNIQIFRFAPFSSSILSFYKL